MEFSPLGCQVCLIKFQKVCKLKKHIYSHPHRQKMLEMFGKDVSNCRGFFPYIVLMESINKRDNKQPIQGLSLLTLCFSRESESHFYLCHICEEKCPQESIMYHLSTGEHCSNYFNFTDPDVLHFSWIPKKDMRAILRPPFAKNVEESGLGTLQILDLPENLYKRLERSIYSEVMHTLRENDKLKKCLEAVIPRRTMIQTYHRDRKRKNPLLGMQHIVECICDGPNEKRYYLCTLCKLTLATHMIIKHVLSFDHVYNYFKAWHPSTLASKESYKDYKESMMLNLAKQSLGIFGAPNNEMKQVSLEASEFASVNFACYEKGVSLVVACVNTEFQTETIYVCFACQESFPESVLREHFKSIKHLIHTMLYHNPWRLHFAWEKGLDVTDLSSKAWEEEKERAPNQIKMKVLDVPYWIFCNLISPTYEKVPRRETYSKLQQNERFPLLGQQFIVMYSVGQNHSTKVAFLCLLCERTLSDIECHAHVFSREHVEKFLVIKLDTPIWEPYSYQRAICILASAKKRDKKGALEPPITPKMKLAPRETVKEMVRDHVRDNSPQDGKTVEGPEKKISKTSRDNVDANVKKIAVDINTLNSNKDIKSDTDEEKGDNKDTLPPSDKLLSEKKRECPETRSEETKGAGNDTCLVIKEENTEKPITIEPSGAIPASHQSKDEDDAAETEKENKISKDVLKKCKDYMDNKIEKKRPGIKSEKTETDICSDKDVQREMGHKSQQLTSKKGSCCVKTQKVQSSGLKQEASEDDAENCKPSHETAKITGLNGLFECHCNEHDTIYLCEYCSEIIPEKNIISHVTGFSHQKMYLEGLQNLPPLSQMNQMEHVRHLAVKSECSNGYGEAQVLDLDEDVYCTMFKQDFKSAIQSVKTLQAQQQSRHELPSVSTLPSVQNLQHVNTTVTLQKQCEVHSMKDNIQVVEMEIDNGSEDPNILLSPVTVAMSALPETSSKTTEVRPKSTKDVTFAHSKVSESADNPVPRSGDRVSKSGTNTTTLHPDYTEKISKDDIAPRTLVEPLTETAPASKTVSKVVCEATQTTAASFKTENTSKNSEAVSGPAVTLKNMATPVATDKNPVKSENTEASAKTLPIKNSNVHVGPHEHKSNPPAAIQSTASVSVSVEQTGVSTNKVGVNQLIVVSCQRSQQVYCQLCSVRLMASTHVNTNMHKYNYVKMKYPEWNAKPTEKEKLDKIVARLAEVEKDVECRHPQTIYVYIEEYRELAALPENIGESTQGRSNLSKFLTVKKLDKPIIGLGSVWECQGISQGMSQNSFYLCECCSEKISVTDICHHMSSFPHLHQCMMKQYSQFTRSVYNAKNVPHEEKIDILEDIAKMLSKQESYRNTDAQVVMLSHGLHESVQKAPFDKAIEIVHNIKKLNKLKVFYQPPNTPQQKDKQPENQQSQKQSPHMEMQSTLEHGTRHQIENERRKKPEKHKLEETVMIQDLDGIKRKKVSSSQDLNSVSSETEFMASSIHLGYRPISPQETHGSLSVQPAQLTSTKKRLEVSTPDTHDLQHQSSLNAESMFGNESQLKPSSVYAVTTNNDANQIPQPQSNDATGRTRICQMPINAIVTARPDPIINQSMGDYEGQVHRELHEGIEIPHHLPTVATTPIDNMAASEVYGQCSQTAFITAGPSGYVSSEAVTGHTTPGNPPIYTEGLEHMEKYNTRALYPSQVYSEQEGIQLNLHSLGLSLATPASPGLMSLEMHWRQQQEMMMMMMQQKQQMMMMMQQQQHQQYPSCVSAPLPAVNGNVTNDAGNIYNVSSSTAANNPQVFTNLSTSSTASPQNSISMVTQNFSQMYSNPPTSSLFYNQQ
ncbi:hypothetical protein EXN66_Car000657 [Channa argus]|uniref:C2H2-type domain-containing protein n=1 Tax=Channa argus TaxID=215402 RepID=A0A6G1QYA9_CHAAH|nr:hypothetical protein EXN66_Car000657 [Channa argus]